MITPEVRDAALAGIDRAYFWICGLIAAAAGVLLVQPPHRGRRGSGGARAARASAR